METETKDTAKDLIDRIQSIPAVFFQACAYHTILLCFINESGRKRMVNKSTYKVF